MEVKEENSIEIFGYNDKHRGAIGNFLSVSPVKLEDLKNSIGSFLNKMQTIMDELPKFTKEYQLDTIEIQANLSASGKVSLLGTGGEIGGSGGIKFVLKKKQKKE
jgi:hypothetical protein